MSLPFSIKGHIRLNKPSLVQADCQSILLHLCFALEEESAYGIHFDCNTLSFRGGIFRWVSNWNLLACITSGRLEVLDSAEGLILAYRISFTQLFIYLVIASFFMLTSFILGYPKSEEQLLGMLFGIWGLLFGCNVIIALFRFRYFLKRSLAEFSG